MHLPKEIVFFLSFLVCGCFAGFLIKTSEPDDPGIVEAVVNILESCYGNHLVSLGLAGNLSGRISKILWSRRNVPVTLIDDTARLVSNDPVGPTFNHKLQFFVVSASSSVALTRILRQIKASIWWNHMAAFLILDWPLPNDGCSNAFEMLWAAWEINILNAKLMCYQRTEGRLIYTFNPYTSQAPGSWQIDQIYSGINNHPWTLFVRGYGNGEEVCKQLDFDKTKQLGGYEIRISLSGYGEVFNHSRLGHVRLEKMEHMHYDIIFPLLNATPNVLLHDSIDSLGSIDNEGKINGILAEVNNGSSDIALYPRLLPSLKNITMQYPRWQTSLPIMTQYRGYKSQLNKIVSVVDGSSRFGLLLVCVINILFFKYFLRRPAMVGYLNTLLVICNAGLPNIPRNVAPRMYLGSLFLFALTMQGIYQGQLASLLTMQVPLRNVNTKDDLVELGYKIYGHKTTSFLFQDPQCKERFIETITATCAEYVLRDPKGACVGANFVLLKEAIRFKLHISVNKLPPSYITLPMRPDWPLQQRIESILTRDYETQYTVITYLKDMKHLNDIIAKQKKEYKNEGCKILTLQHLSFAFVILGIGLSCATISFVIEVRMGRSGNKISDNVLITGRNRS